MFGFDRAGTITVGLDTQTAFLQPHDYITGQNVQVVTGDYLSEWSSLFLLPILKSQMRAKFNWGGNGATLGRMKQLRIMLPTDESGKPDWQFMEDYAKSIALKLLRQQLDYLDRLTADEPSGQE